MVPIRALLFDVVGTLIRPADPVGTTYARLAARHGVHVPTSRLEEAFRRTLSGAPPMVFPDAPPETIPRLERAWWRDRVRSTFRAADATLRFRDFNALFAELFSFYATASAWEIARGAEAALRDLASRGIRLAAVSNFDHRLPALLRDLGLRGYFEFVLLPGDAAAAKPAAAIFETALARLALPAAQVALVGDHPEQDLEAARAVGMRAIDVAGLATLCDLLPLIDPAAE